MGEILPAGSRVAALNYRSLTWGALVNAPTVRGAYDAIERMLAPRLEALVRTQQYAQVTALLAGAGSSAGAQVGSVAACLLHVCNLPAGTDISRLGRQLGELDREVRQLRLELAAYAENRGEESPDADA